MYNADNRVVQIAKYCTVKLFVRAWNVLKIYKQ